ncbi:hypothetical protein BJX70DRAFT_398449 [Aspergillus crustosus]
MTSLLRNARPLRAINPTVRRSPILPQTQRRLNGHSSYGGEGEKNPQDDRNKPTRDLEHPGAPPPDIKSTNSSKSQPSYNQSRDPSGRVEEDISTTPSNNAKPTITGGKQSSNVDNDGNTRPDVPEDVKKHNAEIDQRHDKPYNRIKDEGKVEKGFWGKLDGGPGGN